MCARRFTIGAVVLAVVLVLGVAGIASAAPVIQIEGVVTDAATGLPLTSVSVSADGPSPDGEGVDANGRFRFSGLTPGEYTISFFADDYIIEWYDDVLDSSAATSITVTADGTVSGINAALEYNGPRIVGRVFDQLTGFPISSVSVSADGPTPDGEGTFADGRYQFRNLTPGDYTISFFSDFHFVEWYDDSYSAAGATSVALGTGTVVVPDVSLLPLGVYGTVVDEATGAPIAGATVRVVGLIARSGITAADGSFAVTGFGPDDWGDYAVRITAPGYITEWYADMPAKPLATLVTIDPWVAPSDLEIGLRTTAPTIESLTPGPVASLHTGRAQTFIAKYSDPDGADDLRNVYMLLNSTSITAADGVFLFYSENSNRVYLRNGANTAWLSGTPGAAAKLENERVSLDLSKTAVGKIRKTLTLVTSLTFTDAFLGTKKVWLRALDDGGLVAPWAVVSRVTLVAPVAPTVDSLVPATLASLLVGQVQTFEATYSDGDGSSDFRNVYMLLNSTSITAVGGVFLYYSENQNKIYLRNAASTGWISGVPGATTPTAAPTLSNGRVVLDLAGTSVVKVGDTLTTTVPLTFTSSFLGTKKVWLRALDDSGLIAPWARKGTVTVVAP